MNIIGFAKGFEPVQFSTRKLLEQALHFLIEVSKGEGHVAGHRAASYFSDKLKVRNEIRSLLAQYGITLAELHAKAAQQNGEALQMFERMIAARERGRRKQRKEDERRRRVERQVDVKGTAVRRKRRG